MSRSNRWLPLLLMLFLVIGSCVEHKKDPWRELDAFAKAHDRQLQEVRWVLVITDDGCPSCNKNFVQLLARHADDPRALIVLSATGTQFDIAPLLEHRERVVQDSGAFDHLSILKGSGAIGISEGSIDTIIPLRADALPETFALIEDRLRAVR